MKFIASSTGRTVVRSDCVIGWEIGEAFPPGRDPAVLIVWTPGWGEKPNSIFFEAAPSDAELEPLVAKFRAALEEESDVD